VVRRKNSISYRELNPGRPACSLVTVLTELLWLLLFQVSISIYRCAYYF